MVVVYARRFSYEGYPRVAKYSTLSVADPLFPSLWAVPPLGLSSVGWAIYKNIMDMRANLSSHFSCLIILSALFALPNNGLLARVYHSHSVTPVALPWPDFKILVIGLVYFGL